MTWKFNFTALCVVCLTLLTNLTSAGIPAKEYLKHIDKEFEISLDGAVSVDNRYGSVEIQTWEKNQVQFHVEIKVDARSQSDADEIFERISVNFSNTSSSARAVTEITNPKAKWLKWIWNNENNFQINYTITMPVKGEITIDNKYGDVYVSEVDNRADITVKYGNIRMDGVNDHARISLGYGKGSLSHANDLEMDISYATMRVGRAGDVRIQSRYSSVEIEEATEIRSDSRYDNYRVTKAEEFRNLGKYDDLIIHQVEKIYVETRYTDIEVDELRSSGEFNTKYGGIEVDLVKAGFEYLSIESEYTGVEIGLDPSAKFALELNAKHAPIRYRNPQELEITRDLDNSTERTLSGYVGSENAPRVRANVSYGSLTIK